MKGYRETRIQQLFKVPKSFAANLPIRNCDEFYTAVKNSFGNKLIRKLSFSYVMAF